jgi:hypothetical protein
MQPASLLKQTRKLLAEATDPLQEIANDSGVGIEWLKKFRADLIPNPGVIRVQKLYDYLVSRVAA